MEYYVAKNNTAIKMHNNVGKYSHYIKEKHVIKITCEVRFYFRWGKTCICVFKNGLVKGVL